MPVTSLYFSDAGPFDEITLEFDQHVNVFTGPNNSGKSTVLWVLGELLVYPFGMPAKLLRSASPKWRLNFTSEQRDHYIEGTLPSSPNQMVDLYADIGYTCFVPAQRQSTNYRSPGPTVNQDIDARVEDELDRMARERSEVVRSPGLEMARLSIRHSLEGEHPELAKRRALMSADTSLVSDEAVVQKIIDFDYAAYRRRNPAIRETIEKVASLASEITDGFPIEFLGVGEDDDGLFPQLGTPNGNLPLNVLSQGTQSVFQCLARLLFPYAEYYDFPSDLEEKPAVLIVDEIDAHLHPSWQRRIIPALTRNFPNLQIFCSTHSPLMLAGLDAGQVQLLSRSEQGKVTVSRNEQDIAGWSADEILRNFLGVPSPTDLATAQRINRLQDLRHKDELSRAETEELEELCLTVSRDLLSGPMSAQVERFAEQLSRAKGDPILLPKNPSPDSAP